MGLQKTVTKDRKIYGNWKVFSPDEKLMFRCDLKKANWYLDRKLATFLNKDNLEIKLNFNPKGLGNHNKDYGLNLMKNHCINCGSEEFLTRHHVIPYCYRKFFPLYLKTHQSHDILSMCATCHENYEEYAFDLKKEISIKYNAPLNGDLIDNKDLIKVKKKANCLVSDISKNIPKERIEEIKSDIRTYFGWNRLTKKRLNDLANKELKYYKKTHGELVVEKIDDFQSFIKLWRKHFLDNNECKYLPKNWSIDYE